MSAAALAMLLPEVQPPTVTGQHTRHRNRPRVELRHDLPRLRIRDMHFVDLSRFGHRRVDQAGVKTRLGLLSDLSLELTRHPHLRLLKHPEVTAHCYGLGHGADHHTR